MWSALSVACGVVAGAECVCLFAEFGSKQQQAGGLAEWFAHQQQSGDGGGRESQDLKKGSRIFLRQVCVAGGVRLVVGPRMGVLW